MSSGEIWLLQNLVIGYPITIALEIPVLLALLSPCYPRRQKVQAGIWLTACTYPIVVLVLPTLMWPHFSRGWYLLVAEIFAPLGECILFRIAFPTGSSSGSQSWLRNYAAIILANLVSFLVGAGLQKIGWWDRIFQLIWG